MEIVCCAFPGCKWSLYTGLLRSLTPEARLAVVRAAAVSHMSEHGITEGDLATWGELLREMAPIERRG